MCGVSGFRLSKNYVTRNLPLPLPLGEVAERSEDGEGKQRLFARIMRKRRQVPSQSPTATALPKGEG